MSLTLPVITVAALADSINPCAVSVLLLTIGFLVSLNKSSRQIIGIAGVYILGIFITYMLIGLGVLHALTFFGVPQAISHFGALAILLVGLINLADRLIPNFPLHLEIPAIAKPQIASLMSRGTYLALFGMGIVVGLFEFPCTGGPYLLILTLLHDQATQFSGFFYLLYYNLIFILPLVALLAASAHPRLQSRIHAWRKSHSRRLDIIASLVMIGLGVVILAL